MQQALYWAGLVEECGSFPGVAPPFVYGTHDVDSSAKFVFPDQGTTAPRGSWRSLPDSSDPDELVGEFVTHLVCAPLIVNRL